MHPKIFLIDSLVELPNGLKYGETDAIVMPVSPGMIAPPKKKTIQRMIQQTKKFSRQSRMKPETAVITEKMNT